MEPVPSVDTVCQAVRTLYVNQNPGQKEVASKWLCEWQKSLFAWKISDEILHRTSDPEARILAAQTLRSKILNSFNELPAGAHESLRDSLLEQLVHVNNSSTDRVNSLILTQLSLALADLIIQMKSWQRPVCDLIEKLAATNLIWPLLKIMTVLAEEIHSSSLRIGANRREEFTQELFSSSPVLKQFLKVCVNSAQGQEKNAVGENVLRCYTSWLKNNTLELNDISGDSVIIYMFQILNDYTTTPQLHDCATECLCALFQALCDSPIDLQVDFEVELFTVVMRLEEKYHLCVANEDLEKALNYCRIFTELAEAFMHKILRDARDNRMHFSIKSLDLVLVCVGNHDYEIAEITFNFWTRLSEELDMMKERQTSEMFRPYIGRLIIALCRHSQIEPDHEGLLDEQDEFVNFRRKVVDLIKDVVFIVGSSYCFQQMFLSLQDSQVTWDKTEAALFVMQAVAKNIKPQENEIVPKVVQAILNLPVTCHVAVRYTSVMLLGELCEWIEVHQELLEPILNFLLHALHLGDSFATTSAQALRLICSACRYQMTHHFTGLLQIAQQLDTFKMTRDAGTDLLCGIGSVIGCMPHDQLRVAIQQLCALQAQPLLEIIKSEGKNVDPTTCVDRFAAIFRGVKVKTHDDEVHPCCEVIQQIWPVLSQALYKYQNDSRLMERICRCLRFIVRCVQKQSAIIAPALIEIMVVLYRVHRHSCFLYLASVLVDEYARDDNACVLQLLEMMRAFVPATFDLFNKPDGLRNHPDTVDDFFRLCNRFLQKSGHLFLQFELFPSILELALKSCTLEHQEANESVSKFFLELIRAGRDTKTGSCRERVTQIVAGCGQEIVTNWLYASVFHLHTSMLIDVAKVFVALKNFNNDAFCQWLSKAVQSLPTQVNGNVVAITEQQMVDFHLSVTRSDTTHSIDNALLDFARLYR